MTDHLQHINRPLTEEERRLAADIRDDAKKDFPPKSIAESPVPPGIPREIHDARRRRGMTRYQIGQIADVPSIVVRAIEQGDNVPLSQFHAVAAALGLAIELVEQVS